MLILLNGNLLKVLVLLTVIALSSAGCQKAPVTEPPLSDSSKAVSFLALGDSYTIGEGVPVSDRWPNQLADSLRKLGAKVDTPQIIAVTGWTTDELSRGIDAANPSGTYTLVSLLIGVNNQYRGRDTAEYRTQLKALMLRAISFSGTPSRVLVVSIPDWGVTPFATGRNRERIAREIDIYNSIKGEVAAELGCPYFYITDLTRAAAFDNTLLAPDGLHPSGRLYAQWVERMLPAVKKITGLQ